jgi:hypothetical protein
MSTPTGKFSQAGIKSGATIATNYSYVAIATVAAFVISSMYYAMLGGIWRAVDPGSMAGAAPSAAKVALEILRTFAVAYTLGRLLRLLAAEDLRNVLVLALWLWFGFSFLMWIGAILWENTPWPVAAIHCGDWLFKTLIIVLILSIGTRRSRARRPGRGPEHSDCELTPAP